MAGDGETVIQTNLAREFPGPGDLQVLIDQKIPSAIWTPTGTLAVLEVIKVGERYEPRYRVLHQGEFGGERNLKIYESWRQRWTDQSNAAAGRRLK